MVLAGSVPPVSVTEVVVLVIVPPLHCGVVGVPMTVRPEGKESTKCTPVRGAAV